MNEQNQKRLIVCLDFDGVIHSYESGWCGFDQIPDDPVPGAINAIVEYAKHFEVHIFSTRIGNPTGTGPNQCAERAVCEWFLKHGLPRDVLNQLKFSIYKPAAHIFIDDHGFCFIGEFPDVSYIKNIFKPWNK